MADTSMILDNGIPGGPSGSHEEGLDLHSLLDIFRKRQRVIWSSVAIGVLLAAAICIFMKPRYDAVDSLNINPQGGSSIDVGDLSDLMSGAGGLDWDAIVQTQVLIISSDPLEWDVIKQLRMDQDPTFMHPGLLDRFSHCRMVMTPAGQSPDSIPPCRRFAMLQRFSKALDVEALPKSQVVQIRFRSENPELSAKVVNQLAAAYLHYNFMVRYNATMQAEGWLQDRLSRLRQNIETAQNNMADYQKKAGIIGTDETDNLAIDQLTDMGKQLTDAEADRILKEANYRLAMTGNPELIGNIIPDSVLPTLRSEQSQLKVALAAGQAEYGPRYPRVVQLQAQLNEVDSSLKKEVSDIQSRFRSEFEAAQHTEDNLTQQVNRLKQVAFVQSGKFDHYDLLRDEVTSSQDLYDDLLKRLNEASLTAGLKATNVDVVARAEVPVKPALPNVPVFLAAGLAGGLLLGIILVFIFENLDHSIRGFEDAQQLTNLPVVGLLPHVSFANGRTASLPDGTSRSLSRICPTRSEFSEAIRSLRSSLLLAAPGKPPGVIMVSSALPAEGKSLIALNLAAALARANQRVLIIDADLRRGTLLQQETDNRPPGLSACLTGAARWQDQIQEIPLEGGHLYALPAGLRPPNPAELLGSPEMANLIQAVRNEFDHVVIDTAPVAIVTDAVVLSGCADAILIVARVNVTTRFALEGARRTLARVNGRIAGVVLNDDDVARRYYGYRDYRRYYSYYSDNGHHEDAERVLSHSEK